MSEVVIRAPMNNEGGRVFELLQEYAEYDGSTSSLRATEDSFCSEIFGDNPTLRALVADSNGEIVGILLYYYSYSSWQAKKCFWIEDLYLTSDTRGLGIGRLFLEKSKSIALENNCARVDWHVRRSNHNGRAFYEHMGAQIDDATMPVYWSL